MVLQSQSLCWIVYEDEIHEMIGLPPSGVVKIPRIVILGRVPVSVIDLGKLYEETRTGC